MPQKLVLAVAAHAEHTVLALWKEHASDASAGGDPMNAITWPAFRHNTQVLLERAGVRVYWPRPCTYCGCVDAAGSNSLCPAEGEARPRRVLYPMVRLVVSCACCSYMRGEVPRIPASVVLERARLVHAAHLGEEMPTPHAIRREMLAERRSGRGEEEA